ncbi:MAG: ABC-F family ATP-binding cassette domain-containing protein [Spirochaetaceae bacterium]|nr:ABC-F family ATP-binding cassette domain-containing protein [Spirochaetaceae bacterium]
MVKLSNIRVAFGDRVIIKDGEFLIRPGDKIGLVGPNGAGKTTLFKLIAGLEKPDEGSVAVDPGTVIGYFSQDVGEMAGRSVLEEVLAGSGAVFAIGEELAALEHRMGDPAGVGLSDAEMERYGELQHEFMHRGGYDLENRAETILSGLGFPRDRQRESVEHFSGGWKMRVALARILLLQPDVLLMDEPTNHLDLESIVWLEAWLKDFEGDLVMTSHDREFMTRVCSRTVEVAAGAVTTYSGDYDFYLREREIRREQLIASKKRQEAMLAKEEEFIARFAARASHAAQVQSRVKTIEKIERIVVPADPKAIKVRFESVPRSGDIVVNMEGLEKAWPLPDGGSHPVFSGAEGTVRRRDKVALTGVNGAGKSTLLKVIAGLTEPSAGVCSIGPSVRLGYFSQYSSDVLVPARTIFEEVKERLPLAADGAIKNILGAFQFSGDDVDKRVSILSGGEKSRVMLACILSEPINFLVLDEPTNHLDIASREVLLDALVEFDGTVMIVSHDRYFLRHLANRVFELDSGRLAAYEGDYNYYLEKSAAMRGEAALA